MAICQLIVGLLWSQMTKGSVQPGMGLANRRHLPVGKRVNTYSGTAEDQSGVIARYCSPRPVASDSPAPILAKPRLDETFTDGIPLSRYRLHRR